MSLSEIEIHKIENILSEYINHKRPPLELRDKVDLSYKIENQSIIIYEIRPLWNNPKKKIESMIAKATYNKTKRKWKIFWQRADLKWHTYMPVPEVNSLEEFIKTIEDDECGCFWG